MSYQSLWAAVVEPERLFHYRRSYQQKAEQKKQPSNYFLSRRSNPAIAFDEAAKKIAKILPRGTGVTFNRFQPDLEIY